MPEDLLLGIDVGTTGAKSVLFDALGRVRGQGAAEHPMSHVGPAWVEQNAEDWWTAVCSATRQALEGVAEEQVKAVAVSSQAPTLLALDRDGQPLRPAMIWMDRRAEAEAATLADQIGDGEISRITGNRPDAFYVAAKLRWFHQHEPQLAARAARFVQINGYINYRLTGEFSMDPVHAALLQLRDHATGEWSGALCDACGVEPSQFPPVRAGHEIIGQVRRESAAVTGLRPGTPVVVGTVDGAAAALEAGVVDAGVAGEMTGTSTVMQIPNTTGIRERAFISIPHALPGRDLLLAAMVASGASLRWIETVTEGSIDRLLAEAATAPAGSDGVVFLPYMMGERSPLWHTNARGVFFGLSLATPRAALVRAVLEGTAFALRHNAEVAAAAGIELREIRSVGGGTRSDLWNQIKADVLGVPVLLPEASTAAPFGDAFLAGLGVGLIADPYRALRDMVKIRRRYAPNAARRERYDEVYQVYRRIYEHLREDFDYARQGRTQ